jgi:predicted RNA-binding protein with PUA-like domain
MGFFFEYQTKMNYWIIKSEPVKYPWDKLVKDGSTFWDGVRNYTARNNLREMKVGDICCFYHSNEGKEIVGLAKVIKESYQDPTTPDPAWVVVDIEPLEKLKKPVTLEQMKKEPMLQNIDLIRIGRLSVSKLKKEEFDFILELSER